MFRLRLLVVAVALSSLAGCCSSPCGGHPWFNWFGRNCCATPCCSSGCDACDSCGTYGSSGYATTVIGSPIFAAPPANGNLPPTVVPGPAGAVPAVPPANVQQNLARPIPYAPNAK